MKTLYSILLLFLCSFNSSFAQWRSAEDALRLVSDECGSMSFYGRRRVQAANLKPLLVYTMEREGNPMLYVFDIPNDGGSVFVSGYEQATAILGYIDNGHFSADSIPVGLKHLMESYAQEMMSASSMSQKSTNRVVRRSEEAPRESISHLIKTHWNQHAPYNNMCPENCPTGCVATMTAQIMKYYNYPDKGEGSHSYVWNGQRFSADFGATTYHWDKMLDTYSYYSKNSKDEHADEIARLMAHLGVMVEMQYAVDGSGATLYHAMNGLVDHFAYNPKAYYKTRARYSDSEWNAMLYEQLAAGHPLMYEADGKGDSDGHAFIIDGYQDGLWGINWGWGGSYDGYFALDAMTPGSHTFSSEQGAVFDIYPDGEYTVTEDLSTTVHVATPGTLKSLLGSTRYSQITVTGNINGEDIRELRARMAANDYNYIPTVQGLKSLDLSDANIVSGGVYLQYGTAEKGVYQSYEAEDNTIRSDMFYGSPILEKLVLPRSVTNLSNSAIVYMNALQSIVLPENLEVYDSGIGQCSKLTELIVPDNKAVEAKDGLLYSKDFSLLHLAYNPTENVVVDGRCRMLGYNSFYSVHNVKNIWMSNVEKIEGWSFPVEGSYSLYIASDRVPELRGEDKSVEKTIKNIYVRSSLIDGYKNSENWDKLSHLLKPIENEDYVADENHGIRLYPASVFCDDSTQMSISVFDTKLIGKSIVWKVSDESIATVDSYGKLYGKKAGTTIVAIQIDGQVAETKVTVTPWHTIHVEKAGTLAQLIGGKDYTHLIVSGDINGEDIYALNSLMNPYGNLPAGQGLKMLDLRDANIVSGGNYFQELDDASFVAIDNTISPYMFRYSSSLECLILPKSVKEIKYDGITSMDMLKRIVMPDALESYQNGGIYWCRALEEIIVSPDNRALAVDGGILYSNDYSTLFLAYNPHENVVIDPRCRVIVSNSFQHAKNIKSIWMSNVREIGWYSFPEEGNYSIYIASGNVPELSFQNLDIKSIDNIFVRSTLIDQYKSRENWSNFAHLIKPIENEDYVADDRRVLDMPSEEIYIGEKILLPLTILDCKLLDKPVVWEITNTSVANVNSQGYAVGLCEGTTKVKATIGEYTSEGTIVVKPWQYIHVETPGTLAELLGDTNYDYLQISGNINGDDIHEIRRLVGSSDIVDGSYHCLNYDSTVRRLDLKNANIEPGGVYLYMNGNDNRESEANVMGRDFINFGSKLESLQLSSTVTFMNYYALAFNDELTTLELPKDLTTLYKASLYYNKKLSTIIYEGDNLIQLIGNDDYSLSDAILYVKASLLSAYCQSNFQSYVYDIRTLDELPGEYSYITSDIKEVNNAPIKQSSVRKYLKDGRVLIRKGETEYTITGVKVK